MQAFIRLLALDGPYIEDSLRDRILHYREMAAKSVMLGTTPTRFPTLNLTNIIPQQQNLEVLNYQAPELTDLGKKLLGELQWSENDKLFKKFSEDK